MDLSTAGNMEFVSEKDKETYASRVGPAIYLSQDRADLKFAVKELARHLHAHRRCDFQNLLEIVCTVFGRNKALWACQQVS